MSVKSCWRRGGGGCSPRTPRGPKAPRGKAGLRLVRLGVCGPVGNFSQWWPPTGYRMSGANMVSKPSFENPAKHRCMPPTLAQAHDALVQLGALPHHQVRVAGQQLQERSWRYVAVSGQLLQGKSEFEVQAGHGLVSAPDSTHNPRPHTPLYYVPTWAKSLLAASALVCIPRHTDTMPPRTASDTLMPGMLDRKRSATDWEWESACVEGRQTEQRVVGQTDR